jgi:hypothetical protein
MGIYPVRRASPGKAGQISAGGVPRSDAETGRLHVHG